MGGLRVDKAHAYGNDFLLVPMADAGTLDGAALARSMCHRHHGIGADSLILYRLEPGRAEMTLFNADGSASELSGNGVRCLAALAADTQRFAPGACLRVDTGAGAKTLELLGEDRGRFTFRAGMGVPEDLQRARIPVLDEVVDVSVLRVGNPQCVVLGPLPDQERFHRVGRALATHAMFPAGTNVEFAAVERPDRVRILIWERGVGPTTSSGTGSSAAAVAAAAHGGADRSVDVVAPGGTQRVEWREDGVYLTGWAALVMRGEWRGAAEG